MEATRGNGYAPAWGSLMMMMMMRDTELQNHYVVSECESVKLKL